MTMIKINKKFFTFLLCTMLTLIFTASICFASVQIPRNDGTMLDLKQISDIIRHVTGNMSSTDLFFPKNSLMMIRAGKNGNNFTITPSIVTFYREGNTYGVFDIKSGAATTESISNLNWNYIPGIHSSALSTTTADGQKTVLASVPVSANNHSFYGISTYRTDTSKDVAYNFNFTTTKDNVTQQGLLFDSKGGMTIKDFDGELFAEVYCSNTSDGLVNLIFSSIEREESSNLKITPLDNLTLRKNLQPVKVGSETNFYIPASITVGDLNGDGYKNEIAFITADVDGVYLSIFQISYSNGTFTRTALKDNEILYTYQVPESRRKAVRSGLWGGIPSVNVIAADFDIDGKDELVVLFTDDVKEHYVEDRDDVPDSPGWFYYDEKRGEETKIRYYDNIPDSNAIAVTSGLRMASYKWNGSNFTAQGPKAIQEYDDTFYNTYDFFGTGVVDVKSVAADWDGDGKKSLVVMRTEFAPDDYCVVYELDVYDLTNGTLAKSQEGDIVRFDNEDGGLSLFYDGNKVKYTFNYPVFAHNSSIVAGPFTGEIGKAFPVDSFIVQYLANDHNEDPENIGYKKVKLLYNFGHDSLGNTIHDNRELVKITYNDFWNNTEFDMISLVAADFASEGAQIGEPIKIIAPASRNNYLAILQAAPYHVDTLTKDGTALQKEPQNFTYRDKTSVSYSNSSTVTSKDLVKFNMTKSVETIFALDNDKQWRSDIGNLKTITGAVSNILDNELIGKIPGVKDINEKFSSINGYINNLFDKIENTTNKTNEYVSSTNIEMKTAATHKDSLYLATADQHIWRYPVLTNPAPAWLVGDRLSADFGSSKIENQDTYITFVVNDTPNKKSIFAQDDAGYQPFRELGNLFSYPSSLSGVQGYENRTKLMESHGWGGPEFIQTLQLEKQNSTHTVTSSKVKKGMITEFLSMIDSIAGADSSNSMAQIPSVPDPKDFTRTTSQTEAIGINLPTALDGAGHNIEFEGYLDAGGAMTMAFAVNGFNRNDAIWGTRSLYSTKPDPALLLSQKFIYSGNKFIGNDNDPTALQIGGVRISVPYYGKESSNLLVKNLQYEFEVPVYNASFVTARNVKLRLSYANKNSYKGVTHFNTVKRTTIAETTLDTLPGWGSGNRVMAKFTWTPTVNTGSYYLFVEIDPSNKINEVHENRKNSRGTITDYGGNNLGYFEVRIADANSQVYDRNKMSKSTSGVRTADTEDELDYIYEHTDMKLNGFNDWLEFWASFDSHSNDHEPAVVEAEITYNGEYIVPSVNLIGLKYNEKALAEYLFGNKDDLTDDDIDFYFLNKNLALIPGESDTIYFMIDSPQSLMYSGFELELPDKPIENFDASYEKGSNNNNGNSGNNIIYSSGSNYCNLGFGIAVLILVFKRKAH